MSAELSSDEPVKTYACGFCSKSCTMQCSRCKTATFCDKTCFQKGWKQHKNNCVKKEKLPIDGKDLQLGILALQIMDKEDVGRLSGTSMLNVIGTYLGLDGASGPGGFVAAQQNLMKRDRIPFFKAACEGTYDIFIKATGKKYIDSITNLPDGTILFVRCYVKYSSGKKSTLDTAEFQYHSAGSLAAELYALCTGRLCETKVLEGGLLYLYGQAELFWSMTFHFREHGTVLPLCKEGAQVDDTFYGRELDRAMANMAIPVVKCAETKSFRSSSLAVCQIMDKDAVQNPICAFYDELPSRVENIPGWWKRVSALWDNALLRSGMRPGHSDFSTATATATEAETEQIELANTPHYGVCRPHCMFYLTQSSGGLGCLASMKSDGLCCAWHDPQYGQAQLDIRDLEKYVSETVWNGALGSNLNPDDALLGH